MVRVTDASGLRSALERSGGTVTDFLELLVGERIEAQGRHHATIGAPASSPLQLERAGRCCNGPPPCGVVPLAVRTCTRRASSSPAGFRRGSVPGWSPAATRSAGCSVEAGLAITRRGAGRGGQHRSPARPGGTHRRASGCWPGPIASASGTTPLMVITEWFLTTLGPFLSGPAGAPRVTAGRWPDGDPGGRT